MKIKNARIKEIDILYSIGAILAVFGHSHPNNWSAFEGTFFYHCIVFIYTFHMALFFFIAGVLLSNSKSIETKPFTVFIKEKALKLLTPYMALTLLTVIPKGYLEYKSFSFLNVSFLIKTIFCPRDNIWGHFWFLPVLFICYVIFGSIRKLFANTTPPKKYILLICCVLFLILLLFPPINTEWFGINDIFSFAFYVPFGMLLSFIFKKRFAISNVFILILILLATSISITIYIFFYQNSFARFAISLLMIFCLLSVAFSLKNTGKEAFNYFSKNIFTIYIYSWPFQSVALMVLEKLGFGWQICAPVMFVVGIIAPIAIITIYNYFRKINCRFLDLVLGIR